MPSYIIPGTSDLEKWIEKCNAENSYVSIRRVLMLICLEDNIIYIKENDFIKQYYLLCFLFRNIPVDLVIMPGYASLWDPGELLVEKSKFRILEFDDINVLNYDLVICSQSYVKPMIRRLLTGEDSPFLKGINSSCFYALDNGYRNIFGRVSELILNSDRRFAISDEEKLKANDFMREVMRKYVSMKREDQEVRNLALMELISFNNSRLRNVPFSKILVLDDSTHDSYIGDTCKWLYGLKIQLLDKFPSADITINWQNEEKYNFASSIVLHAFDERIKFRSSPLNQIAIDDYDCILCQENIAGLFLMYLDAKKLDLSNSSIYYYKSEPNEEGERPSIYFWNLRQYLKKDASSENSALSLKSIKRIRSYRFSELVVTQDEKCWGNQYLEEQGVCSLDKIVILPDSASNPLKCLSRSEYVKLIVGLMSDPQVKIVLFDELNVGKARELREALNERHHKRLIIINGTTIRQTMCILASSYIKAVVGPCTGLLHLANGIYSYYLQRELITRTDVPVLLVYAGKQQPKYSAWGWWGRTMVDCFVHRLDRLGNGSLVPLAECPKGYSRFQAGLCSANEIRAEQLLSVLRSKYSFNFHISREHTLREI